MLGDGVPPPPPPQLLVQPPPPVVTVTVAEQEIVPPAPVAVPVYVVVTVGDTEFVPTLTGVTEPIPLLMLNVVAFDVVHDSVDEEPLLIVVGEAISVQTGALGGGGADVTVIVAVHVTEPPAPVAVPVYVVTPSGGVTVLEPAATGVTEPIPLLILNVFAFDVVHDSEEVEPI